MIFEQSFLHTQYALWDKDILMIKWYLKFYNMQVSTSTNFQEFSQCQNSDIPTAYLKQTSKT